MMSAMFLKASAENEPVVRYSSSSALLWELAGSGLASPESKERVFTWARLPICQSSARFRHVKCNESFPLEELDVDSFSAVAVQTNGKTQRARNGRMEPGIKATAAK